MKLQISETVEQQAEEMARLVAEYVAEHPNALLCLAAGETPTATYAEMTRMQRSGEADFRSCRLIGLDEWVGVAADQPGGCRKYIYDEAIRPLELREENIFFFDACAEDLEEECRKADRFLEENGPIDISLMGVGMNGHIALNEPGCSFAAAAHTMELDPVTVRVAGKYFDGPAPVRRGITLGLGQILASRLLIVIANGERKREIMRQAACGPVTNQVPASSMQNHGNCLLSLDRAAYWEV